MEKNPDRFWNPYLAGVALGGVLLATYLLMGVGLGAASGSFRVGVWLMNLVAPGHVHGVPAMAWTVQDRSPLDDWIVYEVLGVVIGGLIGAATSGRLRREILKGPTFTSGKRIAFAIGGGAIMGFAARLARGCTSGQGLSGGAIMSVGGWVFMLSLFAGGYAMAWLPRRQWR